MMTTLQKAILTSILLWMLVAGCKPPADPLPTQIWSAGCAQLAPDRGGYRLSGLCCAYVRLPVLGLDRNRSFLVKATYYRSTDAGYVVRPIGVTGNLAADGQTLTVTYSVDSVVTTHRFKPGNATMFCYCVCD